MRKTARFHLSLSMWLIILTVILSGLGLFFVFEASVAESYAIFDEPLHFLRQQSIWLVVGWVALVGGWLTPLKFWRLTAWLWFALGVILLILVFVPGVGMELNGAQRWISVGPIRSFQPIEFMKFSLVLFFASWLVKHQRLGPFLFLTAIPAGLLLLQPDMGSMLILISIAFSLFFIAGGEIKSLIKISLIGLALLAVLVIISPYRLKRLTTYLDPEKDPLGASFHIRQITLALGSGGLIGQGIGNSRQKFSYIPEASSDSIFAIMAEEVGFIGSLAVMFIFSLFFYVSYRIAKNAPANSFTQLVGFGIMLWISGQTLLNLAAVVALVPLTGLPLPFFSYGGTSLVMVLLATGVLLRVARESATTS